MEKSRVTDWQRNTKEGKPPWNQRTIATHYRLITASSLHPLALTARDVSLLQPMSAGLPGYFRFDDLTTASSAVGPRLGSQRGSWLIIQRKWTKERGMAGRIQQRSEERSKSESREKMERHGRQEGGRQSDAGEKEGEKGETEKEKKIRLINTWSVTRWCRVHTSKRWCKGRNLAPARCNAGCSRC